MTSEARTGVAENWGSLGRSTELVRSHRAPGCLPQPLQPFAPTTPAWYPPQIQGLHEGPAGRAEPWVRGVKQEQAGVAEGSEHALPAAPDARGPRHLQGWGERQAWEGPPGSLPTRAGLPLPGQTQLTDRKPS